MGGESGAEGKHAAGYAHDRPTAFDLILGAIGEHGKPVELPQPAHGEPLPFFYFADESNAAKELEAAGFDAQGSLRCDRVPSQVALRDEYELFLMFESATARKPEP